MNAVKNKNLFFVLVLSFCFFTALLWQTDFFFEEGIYGKMTVSMLEDHDFNIINQETRPAFNWFATQTGNHPAFVYPAISSYLSPFFLFSKIILEVFKPEIPNADANLFRGAGHVLSTVFFILFGLGFFRSIFPDKTIKDLSFPLAAVTLGTSFLWYFLYSSTSTNIFCFAFTIIAYAFYKNMNENSRRDHFILALFAGFGLALRIELLWISFLCLFLLLQKNQNRFRFFPVVFAGIAAGQICFFLNHYVQNKSLTPPMLEYISSTTTMSPAPFFFSNLKNYLIGPNGYLINSPVYLFILASFIYCLKERPWHKNEAFFLLLTPALLFFSVNYTWLFPFGVQGRYQIAFLPLYLLLLEKHHSTWKNKTIPWCFLILMILWNIYTIFCTKYVETVQPMSWIYHYQLNPGLFLNSLKSDLQRISWSNLHKNVKFVLWFLPLIVPCSYILKKVYTGKIQEQKKTAQLFLGFGLILFFLFTFSNIMFNDMNVKKHAAVGLYTNKVVSSSMAMNFYDDATEVSREAVYFYLLQDRCDLALRIKKMINKYKENLAPTILQDPVGFKTNRLFNESYLSPLENKNFALLVNNTYQEKCKKVGP